MMNFYNDNPALKFQLSHPLMQKIVTLKERNFADKDKYDYASRDFEDAIDNYEKILEIIGEICGEVIAPNAEEVDHTGPQVVNNRVVYAPGTQQNHEVLTQASLYGIGLPRQYGGLNFSMVPYVMAAEMVSRADAGFANIWGLQDCAETINEFADEDLKREFLPRVCQGQTCSMDLTEPDAGSDLQAVQLKATFNEKDGIWYLNGVKRFITNGDAHIKLVLARSEEGTTDGRGLSLFLVDNKHDDTVKVRRIENKLGIKGSPTCELVFSNTPAKLIGSRRLGLIKYVMSLMNSARLGVGAQSVGLSASAYNEALKYAKERQQFGKAIIEFPAVFEMISLIKAKLDASRALLYETTRFVDMYKAYEAIEKERRLEPEEKAEYKEFQRLADAFTPLLKMFASEYANQNAFDCVQIHGGSGFMKDYACERLYRDARILTIYEGTSQLQVVAAIRHVTTGTYLQQIREYEKLPINPEFHSFRKRLMIMTNLYENSVSRVIETKNQEYIDFQARRLVEMAGHIIMGYLLILDATRNDMFRKSAEVYINYGEVETRKHATFIKTFDMENIDIYKVV
ncbi:MAG TPA: Acyl-CoA dehydrogenase C-terminal domain-containing protein [Paludibacteraceae bacterium]|nr:acyl-CoA dehydrogenase family protein [Paludibacteraceae bacterium]MBP8966331.1 acyl-CoA dehydrogenase family protein [Paludibacteraceae bacterium]HOF98956.1 Acyl-CoA dehydrogenase C-terminal domain-containing protein [Paludibacteraceae bacterium]HOJ65459.1 Acyl-CoA dehydrogenase C-terminal domain-containing protein [Paludibacteraceae bacterium]HOL29090.1 Acyl-CoA dehydrogenase C-terminal domain-containing protein [Paludibacteraceae bacterium]